MLRNGDEDGLVVGGSVDGRDLVSACRQAGNISRQNSTNSGTVQALEEGELGWVGGRALGETRKRLDDNMGMALDLSLSIQLLRCSKIVRLGIDEEASLHA